MRTCGLEEGVLEAEEDDDRDEADRDEGSLAVPGAVAGDQQVDAGEQQDDHPRVDQVAVASLDPGEDRRRARGYCGATEKKSA